MLLVLATASFASPSRAADQLLPGKSIEIKAGKSLRLTATTPKELTFPLPGRADDPTLASRWVAEPLCLC